MSISQGLIENIITLFLTALLTGLLIQFVFKVRDEQKFKEQKRYEADITRQSKIIESQVQLLESLSASLWKLEILAVAVPYYRQFNKNLYDIAVNKYTENAGNLLIRIRAEISKSLRLVPYETFDTLKKLYYEDILQRVDLQLMSLIDGRKDDWKKFHTYILFNFAEKIDTTIDHIASELDLKGNTVADHAAQPAHAADAQTAAHG